MILATSRLTDLYFSESAAAGTALLLLLLLNLLTSFPESLLRSVVVIYCYAFLGGHMRAGAQLHAEFRVRERGWHRRRREQQQQRWEVYAGRLVWRELHGFHVPADLLPVLLVRGAGGGSRPSVGDRHRLLQIQKGGRGVHRAFFFLHWKHYVSQ